MSGRIFKLQDGASFRDILEQDLEAGVAMVINEEGVITVDDRSNNAVGRHATPIELAWAIIVRPRHQEIT